MLKPTELTIQFWPQYFEVKIESKILQYLGQQGILEDLVITPQVQSW